jgi:orsellinic acid C2-O-methyltransferase
MNPAQQHISALINGFWAAQVINAAAILQLPDRLAEAPKTAQALAEEVGAHAPSLFRLMRALQTLGLVEAAGEGRYGLTDAGQYLRADVPGSVRGRALFTGDMLWKQFSDLAHVVKTGGRTQAVVSGAEGFAALASDPSRLHAFQQAMAESSTVAARDAMKVYDFGRFARVLDLGGGYGGVLSELLKAQAQQSGAVCDLAYLEDGARTYLAAAGVGARGRFIAGDFFKSAPEGFDLYLMKFIIHDWDDDSAHAILVNARRAAGEGATLVLLEQVVPESLSQSPGDQAVIRGDLTMMSVGGKERTAGEYRELLAASGWRLTEITPSGASFSVIEARPA